MTVDHGAAAVEVSGVEKVFNRGRPNQVDALVGIDLTVSPGEFVSLIGPSGCGKSTLLRLVGNLIEPSAGSVTVNGKPAREARLDQDYGMAFQQSGLFEWRNVAKNIELPLELKGWDKAKRAARARRLALSQPFSSSGSSMFLATARQSNRPDCWKALP